MHSSGVWQARSEREIPSSRGSFASARGESIAKAQIAQIDNKICVRAMTDDAQLLGQRIQVYHCQRYTKLAL